METESEGKKTYEEKKKERIERRSEKHSRVDRARRKSKTVHIVAWVIALTLVASGIFFFARPNSTGPQAENDFSVLYSNQGRSHINDGATHPQYNSNPPSSGWHYRQPVRGGFYDAPLADEAVVHNLEHGDVWIAYSPDVSDEVKSTLERFAGQFVVVSPRDTNEGDISLVAWRRVDTFNLDGGEVDERRIQDFIRRWDNQGPERVRASTGRTTGGHGGL